MGACRGNPYGVGGTTSGTGGPPPLTLGQVCDPLALLDGCTLDGYICVAQLDGGDFCGYAYLGDPCLMPVGCAPDSGLICDLFPSPDDGGTAPATFCTLPCETPDDCIDPGQDCFPDAFDGGGCEYNACDSPDTTCPIGSDPNGGTCVPIDAFGDLLCLQNGSAPLGAPCEETRLDGGAHLCGANDACLSGTHGETACVALCNPDGTCMSGEQCEATLGICVVPCTGNSQCSGAFTCQQDFDLEGNPLDGGLICLLP
ncbi:MAG TPA: hypothetical protein VMB50_09335 [Myxococcales bacterium]|nr:hypothetical protein [Myxococcales bacterium]